MGESYEEKFKKAVDVVIIESLKPFLEWNIVLPDMLSLETQREYIFLGFDVAGIVSISSNDITGYIGVGFNEEVSIKLTLSLLGQYNPKAVDIYSAKDPMSGEKDPYNELNLIAASQINAEVEDAVREVSNFVAGAIKAYLNAHEKMKFDIGLPMVLVGKNMTSFASYPLIGHTRHFHVEEGYGCVEFAIAQRAK